MHSQATEAGTTPERVSKHYALGAISHLAPILTTCLTRQEEDADEDEWNPAKSAGVCLSMMAQTVADEIVPLVIPFITENIGVDEWRRKEAAIMAFGSILDGPNPKNLASIVGQAMPYLIAALDHLKTEVRDTAAWTIGRACDVCAEVVVDPVVLTPLLPALANALAQEPRVAGNVCWALSSLSHAAYEVATSSGDVDEHGQPQTYILSICFQQIVDQLLKATDR
jgi:importin subunit beta-1